MDYIVVDIGNDEIEVGDEVVLIGRQGDEHIRVEEWADLIGTINYEIVCQIGPRMPRRYRP
jgi:alanine racemase